MNVDWRGLVFGLMMTAGGALMGYAYGHQEGEQDSDSRAMTLFFEECMVPDMPPACAQMFAALNGTWHDESDRENPFGLSNDTVVL